MRKIDKIKEADFKRLVGVKRETFEVMVKEYKKSEEKNTNTLLFEFFH